MQGLRQFHKTLQKWYGENGRHHLPWRTTRDPYAIYISEIMLQQTQVKTVLERFYFPFLERFPTLQSLAEASPDSVMKQWEGLGYYSRAANLHRAAQMAAPELPCTVEGLRALPGIGQNTAHAVAAFAFHQPVPVLEANVKRVVARIFAIKKPSPNEWWARAQELLDGANPFDYNQAMMDVGAMICLPKSPLCGQCPAAGICVGKAMPEQYPAKKEKKAVPTRTKTIVVLQSADGKYYLEPRTTRFLGGLYGFLEYEADVQQFYHENVAYDVNNAAHLGEVSQTYSHFKLQAEVYRMQTNSAGTTHGWFSLNDIATLALSGADHKVVEFLRNKS